MKGRVTALTVRDGTVSQVFGGPAAADSGRLTRPDSPVRNYMYFRGGTLRFGKLTMADADLYIVDQDPSDRFDFYLARYLDQLVAGSHRTTRSNGLVVQMPDLGDLPARRR